MDKACVNLYLLIAHNMHNNKPSSKPQRYNFDRVDDITPAILGPKTISKMVSWNRLRRLQTALVEVANDVIVPPIRADNMLLIFSPLRRHDDSSCAKN